MKRYIKQELLYGINSKIYYMITIILVILFGCILFMNYDSVTETYKDYERTESYYKENNIDIQKDLEGSYETQGDESNKTISNPILYHKENLCRYIYAASPKYTLTQLIEASVLLFPLVFGVLGMILATNDFKYRTIKLKTVRMGKNCFGISKQLSLAFVIFIILAISLTISYFIGCFMYSRLSGIVPVELFTTVDVPTKSPMIVKFIFAYVTAFIFAEIGYSLGIMFKNMVVAMISMTAYMFILPNLGRFDFKNSIFFFQKKVFDFHGVISVQSPTDTSSLLAGSIIFSIVAVLIITSMIILNKRSSFES